MSDLEANSAGEPTDELDETVATPPTPPVLAEDDALTVLQHRLRNALLALPGYFNFDNPISGINATDLFNLNTLLGAGIELEVVRTLNRLRELWDPEDEWLGYRFERSSQAFPDVRLVKRDGAAMEIAIGIELKGWFMLAKEGEPSLRYQVSPDACAPHDLICVVPWHLSNAVAGTAQVVEPWIESARFVAEWRDYWWQSVRQTSSDVTITYPVGASPYPGKAELVTAKPAYDGGNNYGRLPRCKPLMDDFLNRTRSYEILGIPSEHWYRFLRLNSDTATSDEVREKLSTQLAAHQLPMSENAAHEVMRHLDEIARLTQP